MWIRGSGCVRSQFRSSSGWLHGGCAGACRRSLSLAFLVYGDSVKAALKGGQCFVSSWSSMVFLWFPRPEDLSDVWRPSQVGKVLLSAPFCSYCEAWISNCILCLQSSSHAIELGMFVGLFEVCVQIARKNGSRINRTELVGGLLQMLSRDLRSMHRKMPYLALMCASHGTDYDYAGLSCS